MTKSIFLSTFFHFLMIILATLSLPYMKRAPINLPPIVSVELIQITDKTSIPFAAKAAKTLEKIKKKQEEEKRVVSEQAPPSEKKKEKPDRIPLPDDLNKEKQKILKKNKIQKRLKTKLDRLQNLKKKNFLIQTKLLHL